MDSCMRILFFCDSGISLYLSQQNHIVIFHYNYLLPHDDIKNVKRLLLLERRTQHLTHTLYTYYLLCECHHKHSNNSKCVFLKQQQTFLILQCSVCVCVCVCVLGPTYLVSTSIYTHTVIVLIIKSLFVKKTNQWMQQISWWTKSDVSPRKIYNFDLLI